MGPLGVRCFQTGIGLDFPGGCPNDGQTISHWLPYLVGSPEMFLAGSHEMTEVYSKIRAH